MIMTELTDTIRQTQVLAALFSPAFPIGAFSYSHGIEAAIASGNVDDAATAHDWIETILLGGSGRNDTILMANAYNAVRLHAAKDGQYSSLSHAKIEDGIFRFWIEVPLALGTVGGLTTLHPLVKLALEILQNPSAKQLMQIVAVAGLAQNFAAVRSLVTTGIQKGHMKMHLLNMLNQLGATEEEKRKMVKHFKDETVTNASVKEALERIKSK